jgi:hypothetical protein
LQSGEKGDHIIELNRHHPATILGLHDIYEPADPPYRRQVPIYTPSDRIGSPIIAIDLSKIVGIVETNLPDEARGFSDVTPLTEKIGCNAAEFLASQLSVGMMLPKSFLPVQSAVGDIANSVWGAMGGHPGIPPFEMYTVVIQDSVVGLIERERIRFASSCSFTVTPPALRRVYDNLNFFRARCAPPSGDQQQSRSNPAAGRHFHQHCDRSRHFRQPEQHARDGAEAHERNRRVGRLHTECVPVDLHLPFQRQGRQDLDHRAAGLARRSQRALRPNHRHGIRSSGPAGQVSLRACHRDY